MTTSWNTLPDGSSDIPPPPDAEKKCKSCVPHRYLVAVMGALGLLPVVGGRKCFAMVLTHMTSRNRSEESDLLFSNCTADVFVNGSYFSPLVMAGDTMFLLHAVYFAGSPFLQLPGALLASRLSPTSVIGSSVLITSVISLILPFVIPVNTSLLFVLRFIQGAAEGIQQPASIGLLSVWCTESDKTRLFGIFLTGAYFAPALSSVLTGFTLCYVDWASSLYVYGGVGVLWSIAWLCVIYDSPDVHPGLTYSERRFHNMYGSNVKKTSKQSLRSIPWRSILTCVPVWAMFVGTFCRTFIYSMLVVQQPQYYKDAFALNAADIGILSTLPHVGLSVSCTLGGVVSDKLMHWGLSRTRTRKLLYTVGNGVEGGCLIALYLTSDWRTAITLISAGVAIGGLADTGYGPLPADLAPRYAGVIAGICSAGTIGAIVNSVLASYITGTSKAINDWQLLFMISGVVHIAGVVIFNVIAKAEQQPWADYSAVYCSDELHPKEEETVVKNQRTPNASETVHLYENLNDISDPHYLGSNSRFRVVHNGRCVYGSLRSEENGSAVTDLC